jgi:hypothetical protein
MSRVVAQCIAILSLFPICAAQRVHPCKFSGTTGVGHIESITVQRLAVIEKNGEVGATVFIHDGNEPLPGIVFSHSAIHGPNNNTDLLRSHGHSLGRERPRSFLMGRLIGSHLATNPFVRQNFSFALANGYYSTSISI